MWDFYILITGQSHVLLLWQQQCQLSSHHAQAMIYVGVCSYGHMKCQLKPIPVSVTAVVMRSYHTMATETLKLFVVVCVEATPT